MRNLFSTTYTRTSFPPHTFDMKTKTIALKMSAGLGSSAKREARQTSCPNKYAGNTNLQKAKRTSLQAERIRSDHLLAAQHKQGADQYDRKRDLPGLLHLFPSEIDDLDKLNTRAILQQIVLALRAERKRGRSGHWRYSLARHIGLMQAFIAEKTRCHRATIEPVTIGHKKRQL